MYRETASIVHFLKKVTISLTIPKIDDHSLKRLHIAFNISFAMAVCPNVLSISIFIYVLFFVFMNGKRNIILLIWIKLLIVFYYNLFCIKIIILFK